MHREGLFFFFLVGRLPERIAGTNARRSVCLSAGSAPPTDASEKRGRQSPVDRSPRPGGARVEKSRNIWPWRRRRPRVWAGARHGARNEPRSANTISRVRVEGISVDSPDLASERRGARARTARARARAPRNRAAASEPASEFPRRETDGENPIT